MTSPNMLPHEHQFNTVVDEVRDMLIDDLHEQIEKGDVLNPIVEANWDMAKLWELSELLGRQLCGDDERLEHVQIVLYRGSCFALQVVQEIKMSEVGVGSLQEIARLAESGSEAMTDEIGVYLGERTHVDNLIHQFMHELDTTGEYPHHVELGAGLFFMLCEKTLESEYIDGYVATSFDGITPDDIG